MYFKFKVAPRQTSQPPPSRYSQRCVLLWSCIILVRSLWAHCPKRYSAVLPFRAISRPRLAAKVTPAPQPGLRAYKRTLLGPRSQNRRRASGWELESQIRRAPGRGETPRPLVWVQLGTAPAPSVISLRSTIEVLSPASLEAARPPLSTPPLIIHRHPSVSL